MANDNERNINAMKLIANYCDKIEKIKNRFGNSYAVFKRDFVYQSSAAMYLFQIGEVTNRLSDDFKARYNHIDWRSIKGLRNIFAHTYEKIDISEVWKTITNDVSVFYAECLKMIREHEPEYDLDEQDDELVDDEEDYEV